MEITQKEKQKVFKSSFWYIFSNFLVKGLSFITTPIFSRILTQEEFGTFSNFGAWLSIISVVATLSLISSLIRARFEFKDDLDSFIKTNLLFGSAFSLIVSIFLICFSDFFSNLFVFNKEYIYIICAYILVIPAYDMFLEKQKFQYKYVSVVIISITIALVSVGLSLLLVFVMQDKVLGRLIGTFVPTIIISIVLYIMFLFKGGKIKLSYIKYSSVIAIPFIFHLLSGTVLNSSDKTMISYYCGTESNALYSMAYSLASLALLLWQSMNSALSPYVGEKLNQKDYKSTKKMVSIYLSLFGASTIFIMLLTPEVILIMGGRAYSASSFATPPVIAGFFINAAYTCYVNVEQFEKKTLPMAIATILSAAINVALNFIFIPKYGYIAAAYTTLASFFLLFIFHFFIVFRYKLLCVYNSLFIFGLMGLVVGISFLHVFVLYEYNIVRYIILGVYSLAALFIVIKYRHLLLSLFKRGQKNETDNCNNEAN